MSNQPSAFTTKKAKVNLAAQREAIKTNAVLWWAYFILTYNLQTTREQAR